MDAWHYNHHLYFVVYSYKRGDTRITTMKTIKIPATFKQLKKEELFFHHGLATISDKNGKKVLEITLNMGNGEYVFHIDGERYALNLKQLIDDFIDCKKRVEHNDHSTCTCDCHFPPFKEGNIPCNDCK